MYANEPCNRRGCHSSRRKDRLHSSLQNFLLSGEIWERYYQVWITYPGKIARAPKCRVQHFRRNDARNARNRCKSKNHCKQFGTIWLERLLRDNRLFENFQAAQKIAHVRGFHPSGQRQAFCEALSRFFWMEAR